MIHKHFLVTFHLSVLEGGMKTIEGRASKLREHLILVLGLLDAKSKS